MENVTQDQPDLEIIDLEEYAAQKKVPPKGRKYRVRVNKMGLVSTSLTHARTNPRKS